jgi:hypothetical protein
VLVHTYYNTATLNKTLMPRTVPTWWIFSECGC